jgi:hypothetical protein
MATINIQELRDRIEKMDKYHQIEVLRILKKRVADVHKNENKNGTFVNLSELSQESLQDILTYANYFDEQQNELNKGEEEKVQIQKNFFH